VTRPQYLIDHHNSETIFQTGEVCTSSFKGGGALKIIDFANDGLIATLLESPNGIIRDPDVSFDGEKILFSMRKNIEDDYHIYEIQKDGSNLKQLTFGREISDIDPIYLPDNSIVFTSTREPKYCQCNINIMGNLFKMDADGANIHQIDRNPLFSDSLRPLGIC
jgi:Tol biopolymer transport system component